MNTFKVIVAGGRDFNDYDLMVKKLAKILANKLQTHKVIIISGTANGADKLGEKFAHQLGLDIERYPAQWDKYGKSAGYRRNADMANVADACVVFWDGESRGSKHMIDIAEKQGLPLRMVAYGPISF